MACGAEQCYLSTIWYDVDQNGLKWEYFVRAIFFEKKAKLKNPASIDLRILLSRFMCLIVLYSLGRSTVIVSITKEVMVLRSFWDQPNHCIYPCINMMLLFVWFSWAACVVILGKILVAPNGGYGEMSDDEEIMSLMIYVYHTPRKIAIMIH